MPNDTAAPAQVTNIAALRKPMQTEQLPAVQAGFFDLQSFELMQRVAKGFASSSLVPKDYQGNVANCMIALNLARRINGDPLMCMQSLTIVHGRPTWSSQFMIATANMCGRFSALRFEFFGAKDKDDWGCRAWAVEKSTGEKLVGSDITISLAKKEGWYSRNGSKWQSMPQQMLMYRAGAWWVRAYAPELSMGLMAADEVGDTFSASPTDDGTYTVTTDDLRQEQSTPPAAAAPTETTPEDTESLLDKVKRICKKATETQDTAVAWLVLDDAKIELNEMLPENKALAVAEIDKAEASIKARDK